MSEQATAKRYLFPVDSAELPDDELPKPSWFQRRLLDLGWLTMSRTEPQTPNTGINWTSITGIILIITSILGGYFAVYKLTDESSYERGRRDERDASRDADIKSLKDEKEKTNKLLLDAGFDINNPPKQGAKK